MKAGASGARFDVVSLLMAEVWPTFSTKRSMRAGICTSCELGRPSEDAGHVKSIAAHSVATNKCKKVDGLLTQRLSCGSQALVSYSALRSRVIGWRPSPGQPSGRPAT